MASSNKIDADTNVENGGTGPGGWDQAQFGGGSTSFNQMGVGKPGNIVAGRNITNLNARGGGGGVLGRNAATHGSNNQLEARPNAATPGRRIPGNTITRKGAAGGYTGDPQTRKYTIKVDGVIGPQTGSELVAAYNRITPIKTKLNWDKISGGKAVLDQSGGAFVNMQRGGKTFSPGSYGGNVSQMQQILKTLGYYNGKIDGQYGGMTKTAVANFQRGHNAQIQKEAQNPNSTTIIAGTARRGQNSAYADEYR